MTTEVTINSQQNIKELCFNLDLLRDAGMKFLINNTTSSDELRQGFLDFGGEIELVDIIVNQSSFNECMTGATDIDGVLNPGFRGSNYLMIQHYVDGVKKLSQDEFLCIEFNGMTFYGYAYRSSRLVSPFTHIRVYDRNGAVRFKYNSGWKALSDYNLGKIK